MIIDRQETKMLAWTGTHLTLMPQTSYTLRVICSSGFPYDLTSITPSIS
jgi:hypothetical protein